MPDTWPNTWVAQCLFSMVLGQGSPSINRHRAAWFQSGDPGKEREANERYRNSAAEGFPAKGKVPGGGPEPNPSGMRVPACVRPGHDNACV